MNSKFDDGVEDVQQSIGTGGEGEIGSVLQKHQPLRLLELRAHALRRQRLSDGEVNHFQRPVAERRDVEARPRPIESEVIDPSFFTPVFICIRTGCRPRWQ